MTMNEPRVSSRDWEALPSSVNDDKTKSPVQVSEGFFDKLLIAMFHANDGDTRVGAAFQLHDHE